MGINANRLLFSSSTDNASSDSVVISPAQCRLLGAGADGDDFQLPYDIWWHQRYQKVIKK